MTNEVLTKSAAGTKRMALASRVAGAAAGFSFLVGYVEASNLVVGGVALFTLMAASTVAVITLGKQFRKLDGLETKIGNRKRIYGTAGVLPVYSSVTAGLLLGFGLLSSGLPALGASAAGVVALYGAFRSTKSWRTVDALERELEQNNASKELAA